MSPKNGLFLALSFLLFALPRTARAGGTESVSSAVPNPERFLFQNGQYVDVTDAPRPPSHNPTGVNDDDCEHDLRLDFSLVVSGFQPGDSAHLEVWAGLGSFDCSQDANRGASIAVAHPCWQVASVTGPLDAPNATTQTVSVFARDVLRYEQPPAAGGDQQPYEPGYHNGTMGEGACSVQATDEAVPLTIAFIPVDAAQQAIGTSYQYTLVTDLIAPAPPTNVAATGGSGGLDVSWASPSPDPDRIGFALWTAPTESGRCDPLPLHIATLVLPSGEGLSDLPTQELAGEVYDGTATSLTQTNVTAGTRYVAVVTSVDGSGNYGPPSQLACAVATASSSSPSSTIKAGCGCAAAGHRSPGWASLLAALALVATLARRRASRGCSIGACADGSPS